MLHMYMHVIKVEGRGRGIRQPLLLYVYKKILQDFFWLELIRMF